MQKFEKVNFNSKVLKNGYLFRKTSTDFEAWQYVTRGCHGSGAVAMAPLTHEGEGKKYKRQSKTDTS